MVSMSEFLSGFSHAGESVIQEGSIDPGRRREGLGEIGEFGLEKPDTRTLEQLKEAIGEEPQKGDYSTTYYNKYYKRWLERKNEYEARLKDPYGMQASGNLRLDPSDFKFGGPEMFARLMQSGEMDGGYLSDASQNAQFAGQTAGIMDASGSASRDRLRNASASNMNSIFASRQEGLANTGVMSQIMGMRSGLKSELAERQFKAQEGFVNMMAQNDVAEKQFKVNAQTSMAGGQMAAMGAIQGAQISAAGSASAGRSSMIGSIAGAALIAGI